MTPGHRTGEMLPHIAMHILFVISHENTPNYQLRSMVPETDFHFCIDRDHLFITYSSFIPGNNQCRDNFDVTSLFNSMFLSKEGVTGLVRDTQEELTMSQVARVRRRNSYVVSNRMSKSVGILTSPVMRGAAAKDIVCCET